MNRSCQLLPPSSNPGSDQHSLGDGKEGANASGFKEGANASKFKEAPNSPVPKADQVNTRALEMDGVQKLDSGKDLVPLPVETKQSVYFKAPSAKPVPSTGLHEFSTIREEKDSVQETKESVKPDNSMDLSPTELDALLHMDMEITLEEPPNQVQQTPQKQPNRPIAEPCDICRENTNDPSNCLLRCAHCGVVVHAGCYGVPDMPQGRWQCDVGVDGRFYE